MRRPLLLALALLGAAPPPPGFDVIALGVGGGGDARNLSGWLIAPAGDRRGVACDAGSLVEGLRAARARGAFGKAAPPIATLLHDRVRAYLISHAHLDHVAGLMLAAPDDDAKPILALASVNRILAGDYFTWRAWPNFSDRVERPIGRYSLGDLAPGATVPVPGTALTVTALPIAHGGVESTAFVLRAGDATIACLGDTGPDAVEGGHRLADLATALAPDIRAHRLKAIIVEASYLDDRPDAQLFGHLTPRWIGRTLAQIATAAGSDWALRGLPVLIGHVKYPADGAAAYRAKLRHQLDRANTTGVRFLLPAQGDRVTLR